MNRIWKITFPANNLSKDGVILWWLRWCFIGLVSLVCTGAIWRILPLTNEICLQIYSVYVSHLYPISFIYLSSLSIWSIFYLLLYLSIYSILSWSCGSIPYGGMMTWGEKNGCPFKCAHNNTLINYNYRVKS